MFVSIVTRPAVDRRPRTYVRHRKPRLILIRQEASRCVNSIGQRHLIGRRLDVRRRISDLPTEVRAVDHHAVHVESAAQQPRGLRHVPLNDGLTNRHCC